MDANCFGDALTRQHKRFFVDERVKASAPARPEQVDRTSQTDIDLFDVDLVVLGRAADPRCDRLTLARPSGQRRRAAAICYPDP